jgi:hypothetical protein
MTSPRPSRTHHRCPCGCGANVPDRLFACKPGWYRLPRDLRAQIAGNRRGTDEHWAGIAEAIEFYRNSSNPR